jgi:hypothetical protein
MLPRKYGRMRSVDSGNGIEDCMPTRCWCGNSAGNIHLGADGFAGLAHHRQIEIQPLSTAALEAATARAPFGNHLKSFSRPRPPETNISLLRLT